MAPPQGSDKLEEYAGYLHIKKGTDDWYKFFDLAHIESGRIPEELLEADVLLKDQKKYTADMLSPTEVLTLHV